MKKWLFEKRYYIIPAIIVIAALFWVAIYGVPSHTSAKSPEKISASSSDVSSTITEASSSEDISNASSAAQERISDAFTKVNEEISSELAEVQKEIEFENSLNGPVEEFHASEHTTEELFAKAETLNFIQGASEKGYPLEKHPDVTFYSRDYTVVARIFANLFNTGVWNGFTATYNDLDISVSFKGEIEINDTPTGVILDAYIYYDIARELYLRGDWDGESISLGKHTAEISKSEGYLIVDDHIIRNIMRRLDVPYPFYYYAESNYQYIFGKGVYMIIDQSLVKFTRGEMITLPGGKLKLSGINFRYRVPDNLCLHYNKFYDKMFLTVSAYSIDNKYDTIPQDEEEYVRDYLYVFPDYSQSKVRFVSEITAVYVEVEEDEVSYRDLKGDWFEYNGTKFVKTNRHDEMETDY